MSGPVMQPNRREMLGTLARWTVPTVATMTLGARVLEAKASCPPCQKKVSGVCRACTVSQMLNCSCEPCLGPPYCSAVGPVAPANPGTPGATYIGPGNQVYTRTPQPGGAPTPGAGTNQGYTPYQQMMRERARQARDPFNQRLYEDPFGASRNQQPGSTGLYDRLRPDTTRRRP